MIKKSYITSCHIKSKRKVPSLRNKYSSEICLSLSHFLKKSLTFFQQHCWSHLGCKHYSAWLPSPDWLRGISQQEWSSNIINQLIARTWSEVDQLYKEFTVEGHDRLWAQLGATGHQ